MLDVTAVNEDAQEIVEQLKEQGIKKEPLADAISMTADLLQENGYITEDETDYILINVSSDSDKKSKSLKKEAQSVFDKLNTENEDNIHLTMTESTVSERKEAREFGISAGEYKEIKAIGDEDVSKYKDMKVKDLLENSGELPISSSDSKQAETSQKESTSNFDNRSEKKDENSSQSNGSRDASKDATTDDDQKSSRQESQQNDQNSTNNNTEAGQNSRSKETIENQPFQNTEQNSTNQNDTRDDTGNNAGQTRTEQSNTDNNTGNFGQSSGNSHVEDAQNSAPQKNPEGTTNEAGPNQQGENRGF